MSEASSNRTLFIVFVVFAAVLYGVVFGGDCNGPSISGARAAAADFTLPDMEGRPVSLADYRGKVVFLNIWATWCAPCRREMPDIMSLHRKMNPAEFAVLTVSVDQGGREDVASFFRTRQLEVPTLLDQRQEVSQKFGVTGFPETFLIDKTGKVVERFIGPRNWLDPTYMELYRRLIDE